MIYEISIGHQHIQNGINGPFPDIELKSHDYVVLHVHSLLVSRLMINHWTQISVCYFELISRRFIGRLKENLLKLARYKVDIIYLVYMISPAEDPFSILMALSSQE